MSDWLLIGICTAIALPLCAVMLRGIRLMMGDIAEMLMTHRPYTRRTPWYRRQQ